MSGNTPKISLAFGVKKTAPLRPGPPKALNGAKRPHTTLHDSDSEDDSVGQHQTITHFDQAAGGAIHANNVSKVKGPLVIPAKPNSDKLDYKRKTQKSELPIGNDADIVIPKKEVSFGLTVMEKKREEINGEQQQEPEEIVKTTFKDKTEEEKALDALMGNNSTSNRTIPLVDEEEAYKRDIEGAQDAPTLEDYMSIPVSDFGAACLRGMGWKDTEGLDRGNGESSFVLKPEVHERRPALLGVGAKPSAALGIELGEWGKSSKKQDKAFGYNPVVLKNKVTGEMLTEEELQNKLVSQEKDSSSMMFDDERTKSSKDDRRRDDYRDRDRNRDRDRDRDRDGRRDRDRDDRDRRRRDDYDYESRKSRDSKYDKYDKRPKHRNSSEPESDDDRKKKRRYRSRSRSTSKDRYRSSKHDRERSSKNKYDDTDRYSKSKYRHEEKPSRSDRRDYESPPRRR